MLFTCFSPLFPGNKLYFLRKTSICRGRVGGRAGRQAGCSPFLCWICSSSPLPSPTILTLVPHYSISCSLFSPVSKEGDMCSSSWHLLSSSLLVIHTVGAALLRRPYTDLLMITVLHSLTLFGSNISFFSLYNSVLYFVTTTIGFFFSNTHLHCKVCFLYHSCSSYLLGDQIFVSQLAPFHFNLYFCVCKLCTSCQGCKCTLHTQVIKLDSCLLSPVITAVCRSYKQVPYNHIYNSHNQPFNAL